jgi:hypothetical protein
MKGEKMLDFSKPMKVSYTVIFGNEKYTKDIIKTEPNGKRFKAWFIDEDNEEVYFDINKKGNPPYTIHHACDWKVYNVEVKE